MRKLLLTIVIIIVAYSVKAQQISWGIRTGLNIQRVRATDNFHEGGFSSNCQNRFGFHLGVIADLKLSESFYIQPGLYFTTKGAKAKYEPSWYARAGKTEVKEKKVAMNMNYLQIPVLASYRYNLGRNTKLYINAGPYFALGVGGKIEFRNRETDVFGDGEEQLGLRRFDTGLTFGTGFSFDQIYVGLNYDLGLFNIADKDVWEDYLKVRNRSLNISVGLNF